MDWENTTARREKKRFEIWCVAYIKGLTMRIYKYMARFRPDTMISIHLF